MVRRQFVVEVGKAFPVVLGAIYSLGCSDFVPEVPNLNLSFLSVSSSVVAGHSHSAVVATEDISSAADHTYSSGVGGSDNHTHQVTLTAANFATLRSGASVTVASTSSVGHLHEFTFRR